MKQANDESSNQPCASGLSPRPKRQNLAARSRWWLICWGLVAACLASATTTRAEVITLSADPNSEMVLIPAGSFTMGDTFNDSYSWWGELPLHTVYVSAFFMDKYSKGVRLPGSLLFLSRVPK